MDVLKVAAPIVMGFLGKQKRQKNIQDSNGIRDLLGNLLGGTAKNNESMVEKF